MTHPSVVVGLDFGGTKTAVAVCDPTGRRLAHGVTDSMGEQGARATFSQAVQAARALLGQAAPDANVAAVGVSTFGIPLEDRVELAPAVPGWDRLALGAEVRVCAPPDRAERSAHSSEGRQREMRMCPTRGSTEPEASLIRSASAVQRSTAASEVSR